MAHNARFPFLFVILSFFALLVFRQSALGCGHVNDEPQNPATRATSSTVPASRTTLQRNGPRISFDKLVFDFGKVDQGTKVVHTFSFKNTGDKDLEISSVKTSCGCTAAVSTEDKIAPNHKGTVQVTFDTKRFIGQRAKSVSVHSNDPLGRITTLTLRGEITTEVRATPEQLYMGRISRGSQKRHTVEISIASTNSARILEITNENPAVSLRILDRIANGQEHVTPVRVGLSEEVVLGGFTDTITVKTTSKRKPLLKIPVFGTVEGDVTVVPAQVTFGVVRSGVEKKQEVKIVNRAALPISIRNAKSSEENVLVQIVEDSPGKEFRLIMTVGPSGRVGKIRGTVEFMTSHPEERYFSIPIFGVVTDSERASR